MTDGAAGVGVGKLTKDKTRQTEAVQEFLDGSRLSGSITSAAWVAGCGDSLFPTFQANRQSTSIPVRQEYGGLRIHKLRPSLELQSAFVAFLGDCGSFMWPAN